MNIVVTGEIGIGKSTAVNAAIKGFGGTVAGFYTRFDRPGKVADRKLYMVDIPGGRQQLLVTWENRKAFVEPEAFNLFGVECLRQRGADLYLMDELGRFEADADAFRNAAEGLFNSQSNVLAVVRQETYGWTETLKRRQDVVLLTVTMDSRETIPEMIRKLLVKK